MTTNKSASSDSSLPLLVRKSLRDTEKDKLRQQEKIKKATGHQYEFVVDYAHVNKNATDRDGLDKMGEAFFADDGYFGRVATLIEEKSKDDLFKEVFVEKTPSRKIKFRYCTDSCSSQDIMVLEDGALVIQTDRFNLWMSYVSDFNIEKLL